MTTVFEEAGTYPPPGPIGRASRLVVGVYLLLGVVLPLVRQSGALIRVRTGWEIPGGTWLPMLLLAVYLMPGIIDRGFTVGWGRWSWGVFGLLASGAAAFDLARYGSLWGPPLGWVTLLTMAYVFGHLGLSFTVAGLFATPG